MSIEATLRPDVARSALGQDRKQGQQMVQLLDTEPGAVNVFLGKLRAKRLRGYRLCKAG